MTAMQISAWVDQITCIANSYGHAYWKGMPGIRSVEVLFFALLQEMQIVFADLLTASIEYGYWVGLAGALLFLFKWLPEARSKKTQS